MSEQSSQQPQLNEADREFWLTRRQALLIELAAIERRLNLPRSIPPRDRCKNKVDASPNP